MSEHGTNTKYSHDKCRCEPCVKARSVYMHEWRSKNRDREIEYNRRKKENRTSREVLRDAAGRRRRMYGLEQSDFEMMLAWQESRCAICDGSISATTAQVDHCHTSGKVRGLLCKLCNMGIGKLKDNPDLLRAGIAYLEGPTTLEQANASLTASEITTLNTYFQGRVA